MLKGKTTLEMNKATVIAALQMYLDSTFKESHIVTDVKQSSSSGGYNTNVTFTVEIMDDSVSPKDGV